ncbi:hypothetical protein D3C73_561610 [compost metagenome]
MTQQPYDWNTPQPPHAMPVKGAVRCCTNETLRDAFAGELAVSKALIIRVGERGTNDGRVRS